MAIQERYGPEGVLAEVYEGKAVSQTKVHQEIVFNMGKMEGLMNELLSVTPKLARLKATYKGERAKFVERQLVSKVPKTRAENLADAHFAETLEEIADLEAYLELCKTAMSMRRTALDAFRTLSSDIRSF